MIIDFKEPKMKTGARLSGVTISFNPHAAGLQWLVNGKYVYIEEVSSMLAYSSKHELRLAIKKYGINLTMFKGKDACDSMKR